MPVARNVRQPLLVPDTGFSRPVPDHAVNVRLAHPLTSRQLRIVLRLYGRNSVYARAASAQNGQPGDLPGSGMFGESRFGNVNPRVAPLGLTSSSKLMAPRFRATGRACGTLTIQQGTLLLQIDILLANHLLFPELPHEETSGLNL